MGGQAFTNVRNPVNINDAATKDYVDTEVLFYGGFSGISGTLKKLKTLALPQKLMSNH